VRNVALNRAIETCDAFIRAGKGREAAGILNTLVQDEVPRSAAQPVAHLCYRAGLFESGLKLLSGIVRPETRDVPPATDKEVCTYAILLVKIGATNEAKALLTSIPGTEAETDLYLAFAEQAEWNYAAAAAHLRRYLQRSGPSDYQMAVAEVNLIAGLVHLGSTEEAQGRIGRLLPRAREMSWDLLSKNLLELSVQLALRLGDYREAKVCATAAASAPFSKGAPITDFLIEKWNAIARLRDRPREEENVAALLAVRARAEVLQHWESVREADRELAEARRDGDLLARVYFGTPFPAYRQELKKNAAWAALPEEFILGSDQGPIFDLETANVLNSKHGLNPGKAMHRTLSALMADRYRPVFIGQMFSRVYPGENFIPTFSEKRISTAISRLRNWMREASLSAEIVVHRQFYRLDIDPKRPPFGVRVTDRQVLTGEVELGMRLIFDKLQNEFPAGKFTTGDVVNSLSLSRSSTLRFLNWGIDKGKLVRSGSGKMTSYRMAA